MVKMACDLDEESFIKVAAVVRLTLPLSSRASISSVEVTFSSVTPWMEMEPSFYSRMDAVFYLILNRLGVT